MKMELELLLLLAAHVAVVFSSTILVERKTNFRAGEKDGDEPLNAVSCGIKCSRDINCAGYEVTANSQECSLFDTEDAGPSQGHWMYLKMDSTETLKASK